MQSYIKLNNCILNIYETCTQYLMNKYSDISWTYIKTYMYWIFSEHILRYFLNILHWNIYVLNIYRTYTEPFMFRMFTVYVLKHSHSKYLLSFYINIHLLKFSCTEYLLSMYWNIYILNTCWAYTKPFMF